MKASFILAALTSAALLTASCAKVSTGSIVLQGTVQGDPAQVVVVSFLPGQDIGYHYPEVNGGKFEFRMDGVEGFADLIVSVGGVEFGARVNALDTLRMSFAVKEVAKDVEVTYDGKTEKESLIWKDFYETYCRFSTYNLPPVNPEMTYDRCMDLLDENDSLFRSAHEADMDSYYTHRADLAHALLKAILLDQKAYEEGSESSEWPEYRELLETVDPNDPDEVTFPLVNRWAFFHIGEFGDDPATATAGFLKEYGKKITNPSIKAMLAGNLVSYCMTDLDVDNPGKYETLFKAVSIFTPDHPEIIETSRALIEAAMNYSPGKPVPDTMMETLEGSHVMLSSIFGKVLYIDVWATWCGPCMREIPHFRSLAEKFRNDGRICFISLSLDSDKDRDEWIGTVREEGSFWPQFRLDNASQQDFCDKVGINTIPRFLLIDAEGRFIDGDCARPSDEGIESILLKAVEGR